MADLHDRPSREAGATVVEFLGVLILVALALIVLVQLSVWLWARDVAVNAADEGARIAAESGRAVDEGAVRARSVLRDGLGVTSDRFEVDAAQDGDEIVVRARGVAPSFVPFLPAFAVASEGRALDEDAAVPR